MNPILHTVHVMWNTFLLIIGKHFVAGLKRKHTRSRKIQDVLNQEKLSILEAGDISYLTVKAKLYLDLSSSSHSPHFELTK